MRIAATADLHCRILSTDLIATLMPDIQHEADALVLAGDLTDTGQPEEAVVLAEQLKALSMPVITVLGNHDHEGGKEDEIRGILLKAGVIVLQGSAFEIGPVGFVGAKGFSGGFGGNMIQPFGEKPLKKFIRDGINEAIALENALSNLECEFTLALMHYSPVKETLAGESTELYAFLGSERLGQALDRFGVNVAVHGHAHHGSPTGHTAAQIPVHNVSRYVQAHYFNKSYCIIELGE